MGQSVDRDRLVKARLGALGLYEDKTSSRWTATISLGWGVLTVMQSQLFATLVDADALRPVSAFGYRRGTKHGTCELRTCGMSIAFRRFSPWSA